MPLSPAPSTREHADTAPFDSELARRWRAQAQRSREDELRALLNAALRKLEDGPR